MYRNAAIRLVLLFVLLLASCGPAVATNPTPTMITPDVVVVIPEDYFATESPIPTERPVQAVEATATIEPTPTTPVPVTGANKIDWFEKFHVGVNLAGGDFSRENPEKVPGTLGTDYYYPDCTKIQEWSDRGMKSIRYAVLLQRIVKDGQLTQDAEYIAAALDCAANLGSGIVLDLHDAWYSDGSSLRPITTEELVEFWQLIAQRFGTHPALVAYGLMNEPHQLDNWPQMAQETISAIRTIDTSTPILVSGLEWSGTHSWSRHSGNLHQLVTDPTNLLVYEGHAYFDKYDDPNQNYSGQYTAAAPDPLGVTPGHTTQVLEQFTNWCNTNQLRCIIGEMGFPYTDPNWESGAREAMEHLYQNNIPVYGYAGGDANWWGNRNISLEKEESWFRDILSEFANR